MAETCLDKPPSSLTPKQSPVASTIARSQVRFLRRLASFSKVGIYVSVLCQIKSGLNSGSPLLLGLS